MVLCVLKNTEHAADFACLEKEVMFFFFFVETAIKLLIICIINLRNIQWEKIITI